MHATLRKLLPVFGLVVAILLAGNAGAHPEDEFCVPGEAVIDPLLCAALAELDSASTTADLGPLLDAEGNERSAFSTAVLYVGIGIGHILPAGLDHILFVLALFLTSMRLRDLVIQISTFTVAHTVTLGLAAAGVIAPPAGVVEPLIAASIAFVAIENLGFREMPAWRPAVVFGFGLVHGLGFAGFFGELGLPPGQFLSGLVGFNIGVEIGQLSIVLLAWLLARAVRGMLPADHVDALYRRYAIVPLSLAIAAIGLYWTVVRVAAQFA
ncbi:MAG: HupE/UreJ family protein [Pseudomonadota bacterium]